MKYQKIEGGNPLETKIFEKNENFEQSHSAEIFERRDPLGFFDIRSVAKYQKNEKGTL